MTGETNPQKNSQGYVLTSEEAKSFMIFRKHREKVEALIQAGALDLDYGKIEINIHNSQVQNVYVNKRTYIRESK